MIPHVTQHSRNAAELYESTNYVWGRVLLETPVSFFAFALDFYLRFNLPCVKHC
jgi:hypothetical protein